MGLLPNFFKKKEEKDEIPTTRPFTVTFGRGDASPVRRKTQSWGLTPFGKQKIAQLDATDPEYLIMTDIEENGPSTVQSIAQRRNISPTKVDLIISRRGGLSDAGCVRPVGAGGE
jgi:hypothetical protein